jgi:acetyl-CoA carboxylase carboxyltransferase component
VGDEHREQGEQEVPDQRDQRGEPDDSAEDWEAVLADLAERRAAARAMGGTERLERHRAAGKLDARARVAELLDAGSFREIGTLVGDVPSDALVAGAGTVEGRPVMVGAEDFTVVAGTIAAGSNAKRLRIAELAQQERVPLVMVLEGAGYRPTERSQGRAMTDLLMQARCSGRVPLVTAVLGASAGHGALVAPLSDFTVMTEKASIFTAGPPVVRESIGEEVGKLELGGPGVAVPSGLVHNVAPDDPAALDQVRTYLSFLPSSAWSYPPPAPPDGDQGPRRVPELLSIVPRNNRRTYDMREVLDVLVDEGRWFEIQPGFGTAMICALAHLGGHPVLVVANQPEVMAGAIDADAADKAAHAILVADSFHLPLVFLSDNPGMLPGTTSERAGVLRSGARMFAAQTQATVPKLHLTLRKAYGFGSMVMSMVAYDHQTATFAFPGATLGAMGARASGEAMRADEAQRSALRGAELQASYSAAGRLGFDELIDPRETRDVLLGALGLALSRRQATPTPKARYGIPP